MKGKIFLIAGIMLIPLSLYGQEQELNTKQSQRESFYNVLDYMYNERYDKALDILYELDSTNLKSFLKNVEKRNYTKGGKTVSIEKIYVKYLIAACYFEDESKTTKPLEYMEYVINSGYSKTPEIVYKDLGNLYHSDYQFDKAIYYFNKFLEETSEKDSHFYKYSKRMIKICRNAKKIVQDTLKSPIYKLNKNINTGKSEEMPLISQENNQLIYESIDYSSTATDKKEINDYAIMISRKNLGIWQKPDTLTPVLPQKIENYRLAGISPNAKYVFLALSESANTTQDLYKGTIEGHKIVDVQRMDGINSEQNEMYITTNAAFDTVYFASDRNPDDQRKDIYVSGRRDQEEWGTPSPLKDSINTVYEETAPFLHPSGNMLYFASTGHNTIGGLDIFSTSKKGNKWDSPDNLGFPINTVNNNLGLSVNASLNKIFFSLQDPDNTLDKDIYTTRLTSNIPYTVVKGILLSDESNLSEKVNIEVSEVNGGSKESNELIITKEPNENGRYYLFFPPGKSYKMLIDFEDKGSRMIKFKVPNQKYFYELYQKISVQPVEVFDKEVGEKIKIDNIFSDVSTDSALQKHSYNSVFQNKNSERIKSVVEKMKNYEEQRKQNMKGDEPPQSKEKKYGELMDYVDKAIEEEDTTSLNIMHDQAFKDAREITYNYWENSPSPKKQVTLNGKTYQVISTIDLTDKTNIGGDNVNVDSLIKSEQIASKDTSSQLSTGIKKQVSSLKVFFDRKDYEIRNEYKQELKELAEFLLDNPLLIVEIHGYASELGKEKFNMKLSKNRAKEVYNYLKAYNISPKRFKLNYHGEKKLSKNRDMSYYRRVDLFIYYLNKR